MSKGVTSPQSEKAKHAEPGKGGNGAHAPGQIVYVSAEALSERLRAQSAVERAGSQADAPGKLVYVSKESLSRHLGAKSDIPLAKLSLHLIDPEAVKIISPEMAQKYKIIPVMVAGNTLTVAMADPEDLVAIDNVKMASGLSIEPVVWGEDEILEAIDFFYGKNGKHLKIHESWRESGVQFVNREGEDQDSAEDAVNDAPIIRLLNSILSRAIEERASDIHVEPGEHQGRVRFRLDGVLHQVNVLPREITAPLISRIKILSSMDIAEKRIPQDGRFFLRYKEQDVDLRVATLPTIYGESCAMRLLDQSKSNVSMENVGFTEDQRELIVRALDKTTGLVLVTGPTGSGKTTTLCAMLNYLNSLERKIITVEDPVEYRLDIVNQISTHRTAGLTFASGLRSILRNDPDIILVGEIRDRESAMMAVQASLTGHLLLSTLHTTGTAESLVRLLDLGVEPFFVRQVVDLIVAQRLVRVLCEECKQPYTPAPEIRASLGDVDAGVRLFKPVGCSECRNTGYKGRTAVFEMLSLTDGIRRILKPETTPLEVRDHAREEGMKTFWEAAVEKVVRGETSFDEIRKSIPDSAKSCAGAGLAQRVTPGEGKLYGRPKGMENMGESTCSIHPAQSIVGRCSDCQQLLCNECVGEKKGPGLLCKECAVGLRMLHDAFTEKGMV